MTSPPTSYNSIYRTHVAQLQYAPLSRTFIEWIAFGKKYTRLAAGGSIYLLVLVAGLELRWEVAKAAHDIAYIIGEMVRNPKKAKESEFLFHQLIMRRLTDSYFDLSVQRTLITQSIIPTIAEMRKELPFEIEMEGYELVNCTDFMASDRLFDKLKMK